MDNDIKKTVEPPKPAETATQATTEPTKTTTSKSNNNKVLVIVLVVIGVLVVLGAIGSFVIGKLFTKGAENLVEKATNSQISTNSDGTATIKSNDGSTTFSTEQKLPDDFPKNIPLYSGQKLTSTSKVKADSETTWQVTAETSDSVKKAADGIKSLYTGWEQTSEQQLNDSYYYNYTKGNLTANVTVAANDKTTITYSITQQTTTE